MQANGWQANADNYAGNAQASRSSTFPEAPSPLDDKLSTAESSKLFPRLRNTTGVDRRASRHTHSELKGMTCGKINTGGSSPTPAGVRSHWVDLIFPLSFSSFFWSFFFVSEAQSRRAER